MERGGGVDVTVGRREAEEVERNEEDEGGMEEVGVRKEGEATPPGIDEREEVEMEEGIA